MINKKNN